ncbi:MFS transporter [Erysipelotrichaceae bacterium RD49]|nr:MFS transporter [Erysipelotrichaceae bacterium RD49]
MSKTNTNKAGVVHKPFGMKDRLGYMFGDFGNDFFFIMASSFLTVFYTNVLGISGAVVGTLFLTSRCIDAFTDIGMGRLIDRAAAHADGRYRVWIKRMMIPVVCSGVLLFVPWVAHLPMAARIVYVFITYILWGSFMYTSINIPYGSMASVITDDPVHRASLSTFRSLGAAFAGTIVGSLTPQIIYVTDASGQSVMDGGRVFLVACIFAILALICYTLCYKWSSERIVMDTEAQVKQSPIELVKSLVSNRALISYIVAAILLLLSSMLASSMNMYLYMDYFNNITAMSLAGLMMTGCTLILAPFSGKITKKFGKKEAATASLLFSAVMYALIFTLKIKDAYVFLGFLFLANLGSGIFQLMGWAFISDIIDYQTLKTGSADGGTVYGVYSFARKLGQALAGGLGGFALTWIGYQSSVAGVAVTQAQSTLNGIYAISTAVPAICYFAVAMILMFWYPLSKKNLEAMQVELKKRANTAA